jgi:hypothetical protein
MITNRISFIFSYNMLTKEEVVEMLSYNNEISDYIKFKTDMSIGNLYPISQENVLTIMVRCIDAHEKIIQHILDKLDESSS